MGLLMYLLLGNRSHGPIPFEDDGGTEESRREFVETLHRNHEAVERMYLGNHGGRMGMPSFLLEKMEREETFYGKIKNKLEGLLERAFDYLI